MRLDWKVALITGASSRIAQASSVILSGTIGASRLQAKNLSPSSAIAYQNQTKTMHREPGKS